MQDTSFAIHPGKKTVNKNIDFHDLGNFLSLDMEKNLIKITSEKGYLNLLFYKEDIIRLIMNPHQKPTLENTFAVIRQSQNIEMKVEELEDQLIIKSQLLTVVIGKNPFRIHFFDSDGRLIVKEAYKGMGYNNNHEIISYMVMDEDDHFYGFGEKTSFLDKRGEKLTMWNSDVYAPHNPEIDALYQSIPFFMTLRNGKAHGLFFDNSYKTVFDMKSNQEYYSFKSDGGQLDYYLMIGPSPKDVLEQYTFLTGRLPIPPKWSLGYHQSRYSYESEQEVRELVNTFLEKEIPIDAIYLDIHYMNGYRVFTFDKGRFPHPKKLIADLKKAGIHLVPIVDPGVKEDPEYSIFREAVLENRFCKYIDGNIYYGDVWPGKSAFPDFTNSATREWWGNKHSFYTDLGIEGIWNDMNEPAVFNETKTMDVKVIHHHDGQLKTHREMHNLYGLFMGEATYSGMKKLLNHKRPFLLTRAGYAGVQRYAAVWTGDNRSFWEHLAMSIPMCMNLGISGVAFTGPDVGGFAYDTTAELLTRWTQVGAFYPYFRNHSALDTVRQEPWAFGEKYEEIIKKYIKLRYKWLPQFYSLFVIAHRTGWPIMRPLFFEFPEDKNTFNLSDQFMIGDNVLIAPILQPDTNHRSVYLPEGSWFDYWTDKVYQGGQHILVNADIETLPIFIKAGSIVIEGFERQSTKVKDEFLNINIYPSETGEYQSTLYEDDGETFLYEEGDYFEQKITVRFDESAIDIVTETISNHYTPSWKEMNVVVHSHDSRVLSLNGKQISEGSIKNKDHLKVFTIDLLK